MHLFKAFVNIYKIVQNINLNQLPGCGYSDTIIYMQTYQIPNIHNKIIILALGAESAGNFSLWKNNVLYFSQDFGDLGNEKNFSNFKTALLKFLKGQNIKPEVVLSDLHPFFETTKFAQKLAKKYKAQYLPIQHHLAHVFSAFGDQIVERGAWSMEQKLIPTKQYTSYKIPHTILGIACDGTGLGTDGKIWGGEAFAISNFQFPISNENTNSNKIQIQRVGHLENQVLLGGEMAIREPARFIIAIINKCQMSNVKFPIKSQFSNVKNKKQLAYEIVKKYYAHNEFEVLWNQLEQNFNCLETSSTARVLDAVSVLLGFSNNERLSKHGPIALLEKNSTNPYNNLNPKIERYLPTGQAGKTQETKTKQNSNFKIQTPSEMLFLNTTYLFEYLIKNLHRDKARLAATAQKYIAEGMMKIVKLSNQSSASLASTRSLCESRRVISNQEMKKASNQSSVISNQEMEVADHPLPVTAFFAAGGMMNNKIISEILTKQGFYLNQKIPRGDAGLSFGQIMFYLLTK
ncbi:MAG: hypothetical protein WCF93_01025 [Candidatus Moraniibacteriota bacterium]